MSVRARASTLTHARARPPLTVDLALALALAVALWLFADLRPGPDQYSAAIWGEQIAHLHLPDYAHGPTPHPLVNAAAAVAEAVSDSGPEALAVLGLIALGALAAGAFRLGLELFSLPVGIAAFALVATRPKLIDIAAGNCSDVSAAALLVWAAVLEVRGRRGAPVLALLALAGLLRPEAWVLSGLYLLWIGRSAARSELPRLAALAAAAPAIWIGTDVIVTGDPLWSLTRTGEITAAIDTPTGPVAAVETGFHFFRVALEGAVLVAAVGGAAIAAWRLRRRSLPLAILLTLNLGMWAAVGIGGLALEERFLTLAAVMLCLLAALCMFAWTAVSPCVPALQIAGALALALVLITIPRQSRALESTHTTLAREARVGDDLRDLMLSPAGRRARASCETISLGSRQTSSAIAVWTDTPRADIATPDDQAAGSPAYLYPRTAIAEKMGGVPAPDGRPPVLASSEHWALRGRC